MGDKAGGRGWNRGQDGQENGEKGETKNVLSFFRLVPARLYSSGLFGCSNV